MITRYATFSQSMLYTTLRNLLLAGAFALTTLAPSLYPPDLSGIWHFELINEIASESITVSFHQEDSELTGIYMGQFEQSRLNGNIEGKAVSFTYFIDGIAINHVGSLSGTSITGMYNAGDFGRGDFRGKRIK